MRASLTLVVLLAVACSNDSKGPAEPLSNNGAENTDNGAASTPIVITTTEAARAANGKEVTIRGKAGNAKLGRVIALDGGPIYCGQDDAWPDAIANTTVTATGRIELQVNEPPPGDEIVAGAFGEIVYLRGCAVVGE